MILILVSPPRACSVAFLRYIESRGDFDILHEPLTHIYAFKYYGPFAKMYFKSECGFENVGKFKEYIEKYRTSERNLFIKEMSWAIYDGLKNDYEFISDKNIRFIFLVRDPYQSIISLYKKNNYLPKDFFSIIYESLYNFVQIVKKYSSHDLQIIRTEDLLDKPYEVIFDFCNFNKIQFKENALTWERKNNNSNLFEQWRESKFQNSIWHYHGNALRSEHFDKTNITEHSIENIPEKDRNIMKDICDVNKEFYDKLLMI